MFNHSSGRRWWAVPTMAVVALVATGCQSAIEGVDDDARPVVLVVSESWLQKIGRASCRERV